MSNTQSNVPTRHYLLLDGLRGVAALMVLGYHLFEAIAFAAGESEQQMFHGFLAVDFFLILSGFVMGHAYDSRWDKMTVGSFFRRRLIRLHPMVVVGVVFGLVVFVAQGCLRWDGTQVPWSVVLTGFLLSLLLLPQPMGMEVRGNTELFPLNGSHWSLFFEYIFNILYALLLRRLPTRALVVWVAVAAAGLAGFTLCSGQDNIAFGWSSSTESLVGGLLRVGTDYPLGLLLSRLFQKRRHWSLSSVPAFLLCAVAICVALCVPSVGVCNPAYELFCILIVFPVVVWLGASAIGRGGERMFSFLGDHSYPLYAIHYPLIYLYIGWINHDIHPFGPYAWCTPVAVAALSIFAALLLLRFYDQPLRRWLNRKK